MHDIFIILTVFLVTYAAILSNKFPLASITMVSAVMLIALRQISEAEAISFIDFNTLGLLCGMMMIVRILRQTGFFEYVAVITVKMSAGNPVTVLVLISIVTAVLSALLDNVTTVLVIIPVGMAIADTMKINPLAFIYSAVFSSNLGGTATLIGDPPNILIGSKSGLGFNDFLWNTAPISVLAVLISIFYIIIYFRKSLFAKDVKSEVLGSFNEKRIISDKKLLIKSLIVFVIVIVLFATHGLHHMQIGAIALGGGFLLSLVARQNPDEILKDVEWSTLFFFAGLFIVLGAVEKTGIIVSFSNMLIDISGNNEQLLSLLLTPFSALSASFLSAVPYTAAMINVVAALQESLKSHDAVLWWALSLGACFGANGTIMGSAANLIALDIARKNKISIDYWRYIKFSFPLMLITVAGATFYIFVRYGR
ncbi:MAG: ArsB/NhaD family transporter [Leptospiraceae bacterium]|nr:ArsB/NhaD family transporter [Leptospiraceae bacterium]